MARRTALFVSALVALISRVPAATAAPSRQHLLAQNVVRMTITKVGSVQAVVTDVVTPYVLPAPTPTYPQTPPPELSENTRSAAASTSWALPETFVDLSPFGIDKIAYGSQNIEITTGIPARASAPSLPASAAPVYPSGTVTTLPRVWTNTSSTYQIFYPSGSINPGNRPQGGSEFYAMPGELQLEKASNITLEYSIFFPVDFEWVRGGKLPGLYGGHKGCSGGNNAESCFSTRLMWRKGGAGELYLYAPKDKQTAGLCDSPPLSVCDADYGLSIGRGSFHFAAGGWTHVSQTVRLNTPGKQDGGFELLVNGQRIMRKDDVYYRGVPQNDSDDDEGEGDEKGKTHDFWWQGEQQTAGSEPHGLLAPLFSLISQMEGIEESANSAVFPVSAVLRGAPSSQVPPEAQSTTQAAAAPFESQVASQFRNNRAVGFSGLFFSTFFGGHEGTWASPKDQYTWFKDFGMSINE